MRQVTWNEIGKCCEILLEKIRKGGKKYSSIYGIPRGGLTPAVYLSHHLNLPLTKDDITNALVVDDINDSGCTVAYWDNCDLDTAVLFERKSTKRLASFSAETIAHNDWLIFPWESRQEALNDMNNYLKEQNAVH